jgi:mRNA interferase RelE/StbE
MGLDRGSLRSKLSNTLDFSLSQIRMNGFADFLHVDRRASNGRLLIISEIIAQKLVRARVISALQSGTATAEIVPPSAREALHGSKLGELWKYRVGDFRLICSIEDDRLIVLVLRVGNRREVYKRV